MLRVPSSAYHLTRRSLLSAGGALVLAQPAAAQRGPMPIADMHYHLFFVGRRPASTVRLAAEMAEGHATLVAWSLVGDMPWLRAAGGGFKQHGAPAGGQGTSWLREEIARVEAYLAGQRLAVVRGPDDVTRAVAGTPHIVLSVEGGTFIDDGIDKLAAAHALGVRHIQLVHFIDNRIGDMQTERARHGGLTGYGREVVQECNRLGILIDIAHCSERAVEQVLSLSRAPVVWSHSSVQRPGVPRSPAPGWAARQLPLETARTISARGGVVGLWALGGDVGTTVESYTERVLELADLLGEDHVAFGTDMNALASAAIRSFADLRRVVDGMARRGATDARVRKIAIANYARVLAAAMRARTA